MTTTTATPENTKGIRLDPVKQDEQGNWACPSTGGNLEEHAGFIFDPHHPNHRGTRCELIREIAHTVGFQGQPYTKEKVISARLLYQIRRRLNFEPDLVNCSEIIRRIFDELGIETNQTYKNSDRKLGLDELQKLKTGLKTYNTQTR